MFQPIQHQVSRQRGRPVARLAAQAVLAAMPLWATVGAFAQDGKALNLETLPAFPAFQQWVSTYVIVVQEAPVAQVQTVSVSAPAHASAGVAYQPQPVIVGQPELPLVATGLSSTVKSWGSHFNYQGVHMRQVVLDGRGQPRELRPMSAKPKAGERFKIRVTSTFDAVADVDLVSGSAWNLRRIDQFYPPKGQSVALKAGETVDLPLSANEYFVMSPPADERMVVSVRHAKALGAARSEQPAYRQDTRTGSNYLQLVLKGSYPVVEQLVSPAR